MRLIKRLIMMVLCAGFSTVSLSQSLNVTTPRGDVLQVIADFPAGSGPFPAVILAPGQGYHMALPAMSETARTLVESRIAVFRFNWFYFSKDEKNGAPSTNLTAEVEDMTAVLNHVRRDARVAKDKIVVGGKSLGTLVAWQLLQQNKDIKAGFFLTPVCERAVNASTKGESPAAENYPALNAETRPLAFIAGEIDPVCKAKSLYRFVADASNNVRVAVIGGNHGFSNPLVTGSEGNAITNQNIKMAALLVNDFVVEKLRP
jgi:dienelactone hydrolase